jgi:Radical SAM superfamily
MPTTMAPTAAAPIVGGRHQWKQRFSAAGVHLFDRSTGLNVLLDEIAVPAALHARAPRQISIALTNRCDLACAHCYAPKSRDELRFDVITRWLAELDAAGTLGIGFGGGEPTLHPEFVKFCQYAGHETRLSVSFTTHGHHVDKELADYLRGSVHFIRVSMDGVGATYESIRRRSFTELLARLRDVRSISRFGVNVVVNDRTLPELDEVAQVSMDAGACELLLLPQMPVRTVPAIAAGSFRGLRRWVDSYKGPLKLCINESSAEGFPTCDPLFEERGLRAYAHIDASGMLKASSYADVGVQLGEAGVLQALSQLVQDLAENDT